MENSGGRRSPASPAPLTGRSILVTGATGSFGPAFIRRALAQAARRVVAFSRDELKQSQLRAEIPDSRMRWFVGDVRDPDRLGRAIRTNVLGTLNVAQACIDAGVERAVFLSTDKAPNAATLYGATKLCAERLWCQSNVHAAGTNTRLSATRYGNVIGSRGSVLDLFRRQRDANQPLTITAEGATRFWMTVEQAVDLVCLALEEMQGGEVFVPKVGSSDLLTFARAIVETDAQSYAPGHVVTGLRASEKLHETLIGADESRDTFDHGTHYTIEPSSPSWDVDATRPAFGRVPDGFTYRSDTNPDQLGVGRLQQLLAQC